MVVCSLIVCFCRLDPKIWPKIGLNPKKRVGFGRTISDPYVVMKFMQPCSKLPSLSSCGGKKIWSGLWFSNRSKQFKVIYFSKWKVECWSVIYFLSPLPCLTRFETSVIMLPITDSITAMGVVDHLGLRYVSHNSLFRDIKILIWKRFYYFECNKGYIYRIIFWSNLEIENMAYTYVTYQCCLI